MTFRSRSERSPPRRRSTPSAWVVRSRRSRRHGCTPSPTRSRRSSVSSPPARRWSSRAMSCADRATGLHALPVPISTPGFDAAPYLTATLCVTRDPDTGIQNMGTYRGGVEGDGPARRADGVAHRRRRRLSALAEIQEASQPMPCAIVIGCAPVVMFTGRHEAADRSRRDGGRGRDGGRADAHRRRR